MNLFNATLGSQDDTTVKIGDNTFRFNVTLTNADGSFFRIKNSAITNMNLNDSLLDIGHKGYLIFKNSLDAMEKAVTNNTASNDNLFSRGSNAGTILPYTFRGDARDYLIIDISPNLNSYSSNTVVDVTANTANTFQLKFLFCVYDVEDILGDSPYDKFKKVYFWDYHYQILNEKNANFNTSNFISASSSGTSSNSSSSNSQQRKSIQDLTNEERAMPTGLAIKQLLKSVFSQNEGFNVNFGEWEDGGSKIFYSSPVGNKAIDDISYLLDNHLSSPNSFYDFSILRKDRGTNNFTLKSMKSYFGGSTGSFNAVGIQNAGPSHIEKFVLGNYTQSNDGTYNLSKSFNSQQNNAFLPDYSIIQKFKFSNISGMDQQREVTTNLVHNYNFKTKYFTIHTAENIYNKIYSVFNSNYSNMGNSVLSKNIFRTQNKNSNQTFSVNYEYDTKGIAAGRNKILKKALFLCNAINFTARGLSSRQAGKFISIDRNDSFNSNKFDEKVLGSYFIVNVNHIFTNGQYINEITAIKPYTLGTSGIAEVI